MPDYIKAATQETDTMSKNVSSPQVDPKRKTDVMDTEDKAEVETVEVENVERPVDLYKVVFSS